MSVMAFTRKFISRHAEDSGVKMSTDRLSVSSKGSQVSAGDGAVVKGLKQNLKHLKNAQRALDKRAWIWTRFKYHKSNVMVKRLNGVLEAASRMLSEYLAQVEVSETGKQAWIRSVSIANLSRNRNNIFTYRDNRNA